MEYFDSRNLEPFGFVLAEFLPMHVLIGSINKGTLKISNQLFKMSE